MTTDICPRADSSASTTPQQSAIYAVGLLLPVSYGTKLLWHLEVPFVEPAFLLILWLWWQRRAVARLWISEWALTLAFVLSTLAALRHELLTSGRWLDAWSHSARMFALLVAVAWARSLSTEERAQLLHGLVHGLLAVLGISLCVALIGMGFLPNLLAIDTEYADFANRFTIRLGSVTIPRFIGLCVEPAPFGAFGVAALVLARGLTGGASEQAKLGGRLSWLVVLSSLSDQAFMGVLVLLAGAKRRVQSARVPWFAVALVAVAAVPYLVDRIASKVEEFVSLADSPEVFDQLWGSSGGERILNSVLALGVATDSPLNFALGVGPSLFGIFANDLFPVVDERHQVQVLPADLLCSLGVFGCALVVVNGFAWWRAARSEGARPGLIALLLSNVFQSDFKSPALGIAIGCSLVGALASRVAHCQSVTFTPTSDEA